MILSCNENAVPFNVDDALIRELDKAIVKPTMDDDGWKPETEREFFWIDEKLSNASRFTRIELDSLIDSGIDIMEVLSCPESRLSMIREKSAGDLTIFRSYFE